MGNAVRATVYPEVHLTNNVTKETMKLTFEAAKKYIVGDCTMEALLNESAAIDKQVRYEILCRDDSVTAAMDRFLGQLLPALLRIYNLKIQGDHFRVEKQVRVSAAI
jgi:hypothetical protein